MSSSTTPAPGDIVCPDPSAHDHGKKAPSSAASKAALLVTKGGSGSNDGRTSSNLSAQHNLKYAKAQDLPSFPSRGGTSGAAFAAAVLAKDYTMKDLWQPETSAAGSKAAAVAHRDGGNVDLWYPSASAAGNSAAAIAMRNKDLSPGVDRGYTDAGRSSSLMAATKSASLGRQRAGSTPAPPAANYPDSQNSTKNALNAATVSHRTSTRMAPDGWDSEAMQAARIKNVGSRMGPEMFGEHPPVEPEVEEQRHQAALRASAVSMAKSMYEHQNRAATPSDNSGNIGTAGAGVAHRRNQSMTSQPDLKEEAMKYIHLQDAAHKIAQERLAKMDSEMEAGRYREYYGYGNKSPKKSRVSVRRRKRASSEGGQYMDDSDDEQQASRIRSQMSQLSTAQNTVSDKQRQEDRARLLAAAEKRVQARMHDMDEKVFLDTGKVSQAMMDEWESKARQKAEQDKQERDRDAPPGKTHIGGGKYMDKAEIEAIAAARLKSTLDEINENAERMRARDEELQRKRDEAETARMQEKIDESHRKDEVAAAKAEEKQKERDQKAEFRRVKEQDKAAARKEKEEREAAARREKDEREAAAKREREERAQREAIARKEKADREMAARREKEERKARERAEKEDAKARKEEDKRKSREARRDEIGAVAGGAAVGEVANKVREDKEREEKQDQESRAAGADALADVAGKVRDDKAREEAKDQEATVAGGVALGEVASRVKEDKEREDRKDEEARAAGGAALGKIATHVKEEQEKEDRRKSRDAKREAASTAAGGATLAEIADRVKRDREAEEQRRSAEQPESHDDSHAKEIAGAGAAAAVLGAAGAGVYEHDKDEGEPGPAPLEPADRSDTGPAPHTIGPHQTDIANILDPRVKPQPEKMKEGEPLTFGEHRSDIANIVDPRVDSDRPPTGEDASKPDESKRDEAVAAAGAGALAGGAVYEAEDKDKAKDEPAKIAREPAKEQQPKEKRGGVFSRIASRLKTRADDDKQRAFPAKRSEEKKPILDDEPGAEAADGAVAAGIPVAGIALAAAGGTDEARAEGEDYDAKPDTADEKDESGDADRSRGAEALAGAGAVGAAGAGIAAEEHHAPAEEEEQRAEVSSLESTDDDEDSFRRPEPSRDQNVGALTAPTGKRPDIERHISTIETSSESGFDDDDDEDDDEDFDDEDGAGFSHVNTDSPDEEEEERGRHYERHTAPETTPVVHQGVVDTVSGTVPYEDRPESPVSPLSPEDHIILSRADARADAPPLVVAPAPAPENHEPAAPASAPAPTVKSGPSEDPKASSSQQPAKGNKGIKGLFNKLTSKNENKLHKRPKGGDNASVTSGHSADESAVAPAAAATSMDSGARDEKAGVVAPITTTSTGVAEKKGLTDGTVGDTQRLNRESVEEPGSPSSFTRNRGPAAGNYDDVSSSGAEEEDVKRGRAGRLARKLGLTRDSNKAAAGPSTTAAPAPAVDASEEGNSGDDEQNFEEAQDHFDESLAPSPAFAGQARHEADTSTRETRFQEQF